MIDNEIVPDMLAVHLAQPSHGELLIPTLNAVFKWRFEATVFERDHIFLVLRDPFGTVVWTKRLLPPDGGEMARYAQTAEIEEAVDGDRD